jgi:hypothetical protein
MKVVPSGIKRFKQHLADGFGDTIKWTRVPELVCIYLTEQWINSIDLILL